MLQDFYLPIPVSFEVINRHKITKLIVMPVKLSDAMGA